MPTLIEILAKPKTTGRPVEIVVYGKTVKGTVVEVDTAANVVCLTGSGKKRWYLEATGIQQVIVDLADKKRSAMTLTPGQKFEW